MKFMKKPGFPSIRLRPALAAFLALACLAAFSIAYLPKILSPVTNVTESFVMYLEEIEPAGKLVILTSRQRHSLSRDFSARLFSLIQIRSSVELSVLADVAYFIEVSDPAECRVQWDRRKRVLTVRLPQPGVLSPAILTETLEISTRGANFVSENLFRLREASRSMQSELSGDLLREAQASLRNPEIREKLRESISALVEKYFRSRYGPRPFELRIFLGDYDK
jgi:hypothetical protein